LRTKRIAEHAKATEANVTAIVTLAAKHSFHLLIVIAAKRFDPLFFKFGIHVVFSLWCLTLSVVSTHRIGRAGFFENCLQRIFDRLHASGCFVRIATVLRITHPDKIVQ